MMGRTVFTILYASTMDICLYFITYAITMVADREMPAWQWTRMLLPDFLASSATKQNYHSREVLRQHFSRQNCGHILTVYLAQVEGDSKRFKHSTYVPRLYSPSYILT